MHISELSAQMPEVHRYPFSVCCAERKSSIYCSHHQRSSVDPVFLTPVPTDGLNISHRRGEKKKQRDTVLGAQVFSKLSSLFQNHRGGVVKGPSVAAMARAMLAWLGQDPVLIAVPPLLHCTPGCTELSGFWRGSIRALCECCLTDEFWGAQQIKINGLKPRTPRCFSFLPA